MGGGELPAGPGEHVSRVADGHAAKVRKLARLTAAVALAAALLLLATARLFVHPPIERPSQADAVVVLSGDHGERLAEGLRLVGDRVAPTLVLDGTPDMIQVLELCRNPQPFEVVCLRPDPDSTRAEARAAGALARARGWRKLVVVTTTHHVPRATLLFRRCFEGEVSVVGADPPYGWRMSARQIVQEWLKVAHVTTLSRGC